MLTILDINPSTAGISGDMFIAGLIQFTDDQSILDDLVSVLNHLEPNFKVEIVSTLYEGIPGKSLELSNERSKITGRDLPNIINSCMDKLGISGVYNEMGQQAINILIIAEKNVHQSQEVHLHELGSIDTVFDIVGTMYLLQQLNITDVIIHPVATGRGSVDTAHGVLPIPAPATQFILEQGEIPSCLGPNGEATTPTGAALIFALQLIEKEIGGIIWNNSTYGYGTRRWKDRGNFLRLRLGEITSEHSEIGILETNLDDVTGEILGDALTRLLNAGALDVNYYPIVMKKNRPAYTLRVLVKYQDIERIANLIMELTGTLGVRMMKIDRHLGHRLIEHVEIFVEEWDRKINLRVKRSNRDKIEFDDIIQIADELGKTPLDVKNTLYQYLNWREEK